MRCVKSFQTELNVRSYLNGNDFEAVQIELPNASDLMHRPVHWWKPTAFFHPVMDFHPNENLCMQWTIASYMKLIRSFPSVDRISNGMQSSWKEWLCAVDEEICAFFLSLKQSDSIFLPFVYVVWVHNGWWVLVCFSWSGNCKALKHWTIAFTWAQVSGQPNHTWNVWFLSLFGRRLLITYIFNIVCIV